MKYKKSMIIIILAIFLFCISGVCASELNGTLCVSEDASAIELVQYDGITTDESQQTVETNDMEILAAGNDDKMAAEEMIWIN